MNALDFQAACRARLIAVDAVTDIVSTRVYDEPPQDPTFPYIRFGAIEDASFDQDGALASEISMDLEVYSRPASGRVECTQIVDAVRHALHRQEGEFDELTGGGILVQCIVEDTRVVRMGDGRTYFGLVALNIIIDGGRA